MRTRRALVCIYPVLALSALSATPPEDSATREAALKLISASGIREQIGQNLPPLLANASKLASVGCSDMFVAEWKNRFTERFTADRVIEVVVPVYEKHFTVEELEELTRLREAATQGKPQTPSKQLTEKLQAEAITIQSEVMGATTQLGAKIGGDVAKEITTEHPDWCPPKKQ